MKFKSSLMVVVAVAATIVVIPGAAHADRYVTYKNSSARGGTLYTHSAMGPRSGGRTTVVGSVFRLYANTYNGADGGLYATSNGMSGIIVLSHPRYGYGRSGCKWVLPNPKGNWNMKCEARIAS